MPVTSAVQKTKQPGTVVPSSRRGTQSAPSAPDSRSIPSRNQRRDALPPLIPTTSHPKQMPMRQDGGPLRIPVPAPTARLPETNNAEKAQIIRPPSSKPSSVPESLIPRYNQKNNLVVAKVQSVGPSYPSTIQPFVKAGHSTARGTGFQIGQSRPCAPSSKEIEMQKVSSQTFSRRVVAYGGQPVPKGPECPQVAKAPATRLYLGTKNLGVQKPAPEDVDVFSVAASPAHPTPANTHYTLPAPRNTTRPQRSGCHIQKSPFRPRRPNTSCAKTPSEVFATSTPPCGTFSSALSPPRIYGAKPIPHTHAPNSPRILCFQRCGLRPVIDGLDFQLDLAPMRQDPCMNIPAKSSTPRIKKDFFTSTPRRSFPLPLSPPRIYGAKLIPHTHAPSSPRTSCFRGCGLRGVLEGRH